MEDKEKLKKQLSRMYNRSIIVKIITFILFLGLSIMLYKNNMVSINGIIFINSINLITTFFVVRQDIKQKKDVINKLYK